MGCWNKTCGLTNLPIMSGEDTYVFVLQRQNEIHSHCHATHLYQPLLLPFLSTYNDYGGGENSRGAAFPVVMEGIRQSLVELPQGENPYHDIPISRDQWDEEMFFESVHEHRLKIKRGGESELTFVMMRRDAVNDLFDSYEFEEYVGENKGTVGYKNSYIRYKMPDVISDIDAFFDAMVRIQQERHRAWPSMDMLASSYLNQLQETGGLNRAAQWCRHGDGYRHCNVVPVNELILELLLSGDRAQARALMVEHLRAKFVDTFMSMTRKSWIPGGHEGSQGQEFEPYRALISTMNKIMDTRDAEWAVENGEDKE